MRVSETKLEGVLVIDPAVFGDERGFFFESFNKQQFKTETGLDLEFVQDNHSKSAHGILRGMHFQIKNVQDKLVRVISGEVFDVAVDLRKSSPNFGKWVGEILSAENKKQLFVPKGFAHGFVVTSQEAEVLYKTTDFYTPDAERYLNWNCPQVGVKWPIDVPILNERDANAPHLDCCECF
jgi:dTDP-4-dehydrorhamnose 3,5-epimerase